jgi:hypothetical protein
MPSLIITSQIPPDAPHVRVFVFDVDETLLIFNGLVNNAYANSTDKSLTVARALGEVFETAIFNMLDLHFYFREIEACNIIHGNALKDFDDGRPLNMHNFLTDGFDSKDALINPSCKRCTN